ncbi:MAG: carboxypeptidase regulatory-like domain-containing protein [Salinibacter sp.]
MRPWSWFRSVGMLLGLLVFTWGAQIGRTVHAQPTRPLAQALKQLSAAAEVSLVYEAALVRGHSADCVVEDTAPEAALHCLLDGTDLDFVRTSAGTYVIKTDVRRPPQTGSVTGVVWDPQRDEPLSRVHITTTKTTAGTVSDDDGRFRLEGLVAGSHSLVLRRVGYETRTVDVAVRPGASRRDTIALRPVPVTLAPVVVDASSTSPLGPSRKSATLPARALSRSGPLGTPSVAHATGRLLGVSTTAPYADLHIQGGARGDHEIRLDGVPVRNPTTAGRLLGAFSPLALDGLTARKAGFGALRGDALSGVIGLEHDLDRRDTRHATVRVDPVGVNGRVEGRVDLGGTTVRLMGAGRAGLWNVHRARSLQSLIEMWSVLDPVLTAAQLSADTSLAGGTFEGRRARPQSQFADLHAAAEFSFDPTRRLYVSMYHGRSRLEADLVAGAGAQKVSGVPRSAEGDGPIPLPSSDHYAWTNTLTQARYETALSTRTTATVQAFLSRYQATSRFEVGRLRGYSSSGGALDASLGSRAANSVSEIGLHGTVDVSLADRSDLRVSAGLTSLGARADLANAFVGTFRHSTRRPRLTAAGKAEVGLGRAVTVEGGLRLTARPATGGLYAEPRAALRYHRPDTGVGDVAVRVGGGLYRQFTTQFSLARDGATSVVPSTTVWTPLPESLAPPRAYHLSTTATWEPAPAWSVGTEGYWKWQPHLLAVDYPALADGTGATAPAQVLSSSQGRTYGGGVQVSYEGAAATGTLRYAYTRARRSFPGRFGGRRVPAPWSEPHRLTLEARVPLGEVLTVNLQGNGIWGRRWGYRRSYYAYLPTDGREDVPDFDNPSDHVLPPLYRLDAGLVAEHAWGDVSVTGRVGLLNVLGRANVADWGLRPEGDGTLTRWPRTLPGRRAIVSLEVRY